MSKGKAVRCAGKKLAVYYQINEEIFRSYDGSCPSDNLELAQKRQAGCNRMHDFEARSIVIITPKGRRLKFPAQLTQREIEDHYEVIQSS